MSRTGQGNAEKIRIMKEYVLHKVEKMKTDEDKQFFLSLVEVLGDMQVEIDALEREINPSSAFIDLLGHDDIPHSLRG